MDHIAPVIAGFDWLSDADKQKIFEGNARKVFRI
jgi:4-oxalmesaconate hydratase/OH-DDVA meta-cleavage compound hydrolase